MNAIAVIPARSGSKGLKDKNIADVCGKPLMAYTIQAALGSGCFDTVMVSTDSQQYADVAVAWGAEVPFLRSAATSSDTAGTWDAVREVLEGYRNMGKTYDYVAVLQPTSPLRTCEDIRGAWQKLQEPGVTNVVTVTEVAHPVQWCFQLDESRSMADFADSPYNAMRRQDLQKHYQENGAVYFVDAKKIMDQTYDLYKDGCYGYIMPRSRSVDIDEEIDLIIVKAIIEHK